MSANTLERLIRWFDAHSDGEWEHDFGLRIESLDNPGWRLRIRLADTELESVPFQEVRDRYDHPTEWMRCWRDGDMYETACGVPRLADALDIFLSWAEAHAD